MRILGVNIPDNKRADFALTYIKGIGLNTSKKVFEDLGIDASKRAKDLKSEEVNKIQGYIESNFKIEGELRQEVRKNISRLKELKTYRGIRHAKKLPVRGQRTKTNTRTVRGNVRRTAGSGKRKAELK